MMSRRHKPQEDKGAAVIETAMVLSLLLMLALGAFEYGMAFREWLSVTSATREGARLAAQAGDYVDTSDPNNKNADCLILEATAGALRSLDASQVVQVTIFESNASGDFTSNQERYRPSVSGDSAALLRCNSGWFSLGGNWPPSARDNDGSVRDWIGVRLEFRHTWITGFLWWSGNVTWTDDAIMRMEPNYDF